MPTVEATYNRYYFVDLAQEYAKEVFLANSYELKALLDSSSVLSNRANRHKKTGKILAYWQAGMQD